MDQHRIAAFKSRLGVPIESDDSDISAAAIDFGRNVGLALEQDIHTRKGWNVGRVSSGVGPTDSQTAAGQ